MRQQIKTTEGLIFTCTNQRTKENKSFKANHSLLQDPKNCTLAPLQNMPLQVCATMQGSVAGWVSSSLVCTGLKSYYALYYHYLGSFELGLEHTLVLLKQPFLPLLQQCHQQYELYHQSQEHSGCYQTLDYATLLNEHQKMLHHIHAP